MELYIGLAVVAIVSVFLIVRSMKGKAQTTEASPVSQAAGPVSAPAPAPVKAPGSAGEIKLHSVPDKQAAMIMAIVADTLKTPLNELRFKSIKLIDDGNK